MRILILGAGQVGASLASHLNGENNDITLVDVDDVRLKDLAQHHDLRTVAGNAAYPAVLQRAGRCLDRRDQLR